MEPKSYIDMNRNEKELIWFAVVNIYAASKKASSSWKDAEECLKSRGVKFHGTMTGKAGTASELTFDACMAGYRRFIAVGGDGTVHDVLNGIAAFVDWNESSGITFSDFTLGVIPLGSGNDWVKSLGIPCDVSKAIDILADGEVARQDVVRATIFDPLAFPEEKIINISYMANVGGVGIDAKVCRYVNRMKQEGKRGKILYVTSLLRAIKERIPSRVKVICDGKEVFDGQYLSIAFGVGKYSGGGMRQTPAAVSDDGLLDMTIIPDLPMRRIAREAPRLFTGTFLKVPELTVAKSKTIRVIPADAGQTQTVEVDGEVVGNAPVGFEVLDKQLNIVVPKAR